MNPLVLLAQVEDDPGAGFGIFAGMSAAVVIIALVIGLAVTLFSLWMLIDAVMNEPEPLMKVLWAAVILCFPFLGAVAYFFARRSTRARPTPLS